MGRAVSTVLFIRITGSLTPSVPSQQYNRGQTVQPRHHLQFHLSLSRALFRCALCLQGHLAWVLSGGSQSYPGGFILFPWGWAFRNDFHWYLVVTLHEHALFGSPTNRYRGANNYVTDESLVRVFWSRIMGGENGLFFPCSFLILACVGNEIITQWSKNNSLALRGGAPCP